MQTPVIRLIATDMDGTLINSRRQISPANIDALNKAMQAGVCVALCSGRTARNSASVAHRFGLRGCALLAMNGAYCAMDVNDEPFEVRELAPRVRGAAIDMLKELGGTLVCFSPDTVVTINNGTYDDYAGYGGGEKDEYAVTQLRGFDALERLKSLNKLVYIDDDAERLRRATELVGELSGITVASSWENNIEIMPEGVSKGGAVCALAHRLGVDMSEVMTLGDYDNDLSMIERAGFGVAMGNANPRVKSAARYVTGTNDEDGVARAIERFVLGHK